MKLDTAQQAAQVATARAVASVEAELTEQTLENSRLRSRNIQLEGQVTNLLAENSGLRAEIANLRAALAAANIKTEF
jgi:regulator of replication initiation timing